MFSYARTMAALSVLAASTNGLAQTISIGFDDLGPLTPIGSHYSNLGVTFQNAQTVEYRNGQPVFCRFAGATCPSVIKSTDSFSNGFQPQPNTPISATFSAPVNYVSLTGLSVGVNGFLLRGYDAPVGGNLVASSQAVINPPSNNDSHLDLIITGSNILRIEFSQFRYATVNNDIQFDNLEYRIQPVPEPAAHLVFATGLAGLIALTRYASRRRTY
jgi:hypothetical protein